MSEPNDSKIALHEDAHDGLTIVPKSEWTEYDQLIWDQFDRMVDEFCRDMPVPSIIAIGRTASGAPVALSQVEFTEGVKDGIDTQISLWDDESYSRILIVEGQYFTYPKEKPKDDITLFENWSNGNLFSNDGSFDIFKDNLPLEHISSVEYMLHDSVEKYDEEKDDYVTYNLAEFIEEEVGDPSNIVDPNVRQLVQGKIAEASRFLCPICKANAQTFTVCNHYLFMIEEEDWSEGQDAPLWLASVSSDYPDLIKEAFESLWLKLKPNLAKIDSNFIKPFKGNESIENLLTNILKEKSDWKVEDCDDHSFNRSANEYIMTLYNEVSENPIIVRNEIADRPGLSWESICVWSDNAEKVVKKMISKINSDAELLG